MPNLHEEASTKITLQKLMHYHGLKKFKDLLKDAYYNASEEMEDISEQASWEYRREAHKLEEDNNE